MPRQTGGVSFTPQWNFLGTGDTTTVQLYNSLNGTYSLMLTKPQADLLYAPLSGGGFVPYTGATADVNLGNYALIANKLTVTGSAGNGFINLPYQSSAPTTPTSSTNLYAASAANRLNIQGANGYVATLSTQALNSNQIYSFPDNGGLIYTAASNASGSIPYATSGVATTSLPIGSNGNILGISSGLPSWRSPAQALSDIGALASSGTAANATLWNSQSNSMSGLANGDIMQYNGTNWINATVSATAPLQKSGVGAGGTWSITQANTSTNGYLSSTDWNTFNGKQTALSGTGFVKISGTTISYDNSTYLPTSGFTTTAINALYNYTPADGGNVYTKAQSDGRYGLLAGKVSQFALTSSSDMRTVISDVTGAGSMVFSQSPVFNPTTGSGVAVNSATSSGYNGTLFLGQIAQGNSSSYDLIGLYNSTNSLKFNVNGQGNLFTSGTATIGGNISASNATFGSVTGYPFYLNNGTYTSPIVAGTLTAARTWTFPDATGAVALLQNNMSSTTVFSPSVTAVKDYVDAAGRTVVVTSSTSITIPNLPIGSSEYDLVLNGGSLQTVTLPADITAGARISITSAGTGGWKIAQGLSNQIKTNGGATTVGTSGYVQSTANTDCITIECINSGFGNTSVYTTKSFVGGPSFN